MPREQERVPFFVEVVLESASGKRHARISDLSLGGCFIDSIALMTQGEAVAFDLAEESGRLLHFTGRVTYVLPGVGFGVRFTNVSEEQQAFLDEIVGVTADSGTPS
jgi:PilZ domain